MFQLSPINSIAEQINPFNQNMEYILSKTESTYDEDIRKQTLNCIFEEINHDINEESIQYSNEDVTYSSNITFEGNVDTYKKLQNGMEFIEIEE